MAVLTAHRFRVADYHRMAETGVFHPGERVELLEGEIIDMMPIGPFHAGANDRLAKLFIRLTGDRCHVSIQNPVRLDDHSEPQPDLMLLKPAADDYTLRHPVPEDVLLLIEVADTTLAYDRERKLPAYARVGVPEVWIVNLVERTIEVYRDPDYLGYGSTTVLRPGEMARPLAFADLTVDVAAVLRQAG